MSSIGNWDDQYANKFIYILMASQSLRSETVSYRST